MTAAQRRRLAAALMALGSALKELCEALAAVLEEPGSADAPAPPPRPRRRRRVVVRPPDEPVSDEDLSRARQILGR